MQPRTEQQFVGIHLLTGIEYGLTGNEMFVTHAGRFGKQKKMNLMALIITG
jgi:hypothetical protein